MISKKFTLNKQDVIFWSKEALRVSGPYLVVIIPVLIDKLPKEAGWTAIAIFILQRIRSAIELYTKGK